MHTGRHFLQIPGPSNIPDRVLRAIDRPVMDHRGAEFASIVKESLEGMRKIVQTRGPVVMYPASGSGAWEAAIVNTLSPGDWVLMFETGHFSRLWRQVAERFGIHIDYLPGTWRTGAVVADIEAKLSDDKEHRYKAMMVVHNETSTGTTSKISEIRRTMNRLGHPALLMVDAVSSLGSIEYRHDEWEVDVMIASSQKGLMLPPGLAFNAISEKAMIANKTAKLPRSYWDWPEILELSRNGFFPYTPSINLIFGLREAVQMLLEEGLPNVFSRHQRHGHATRAAVRSWGLELVCEEPTEYSNTVTAVFVPEGHSADELRATILDNFDMSLGAGLSKLANKVFRIGHLGHFNDLMLAGTLAGVEMGLRQSGIPHTEGGMMAALDSLAPKSKPVAVRT
ncbi:MAG TPA: aminotransferase class V-fold PLP-dependent enzyme [Verrucomicrobiae bacterium]|nr:aminotransferase class V-fold PLP-dependent enzyme [Verrucomicrobiae bacterium]